MSNELKDVVAAKGQTLTKSDICECVAERTGLPVSAVRKVLNDAFEVIVQSVSYGHPVQLKGFATFSARYSPEYEARNPQTGEPITVPERVLPSVRFGEPFKRTVDTEFKRGSEPLDKDEIVWKEV